MVFLTSFSTKFYAYFLQQSKIYLFPSLNSKANSKAVTDLLSVTAFVDCLEAFIKAPYRNQEWLYNEYITKNRFAKDIANQCGINVRTLRWWIASLGLPKKEIFYIDKYILSDLYVAQHKTAVEIGQMYGVDGNTISAALKKYEIKMRSHSENVKYAMQVKGSKEKVKQSHREISARIRVSCRRRGIPEEDFDGFVTNERLAIRYSRDYATWRKSVLERDDYTCQCCGKRGGNLNVHHIENFTDREDLWFEINNGITLCEKCHLPKYSNSFHSLYGQRNNNLSQLKEYIMDRQRQLQLQA